MAMTTNSSIRVKAAGLGSPISSVSSLDSRGSPDDRRAVRKTDEDLVFMFTLSPGFALHLIKVGAGFFRGPTGSRRPAFRARGWLWRRFGRLALAIVDGLLG